MKNFSLPIEISAWKEISERYTSRVDRVGKIRSEKIPNEDMKWLEGLLAEDLKRFSGRTENHALLSALLFYSPPKSTRGLHVDYFGDWHNHPTWALNLPILNCENSEMTWYEGEYTKEVKTVQGGSPHYHLTWSSPAKLLESANIDKPSVVYVDIPHDVANHGDLPRIMLSLRFKPTLFTRFA